jgi:Gas vesicle synthesis protein GvpL/GvpF
LGVGGEGNSRLERAAADLARSEVRELLDEAVHEARAEAKSLLRELMLRAYLKESAGRLQQLERAPSRAPDSIAGGALGGHNGPADQIPNHPSDRGTDAHRLAGERASDGDEDGGDEKGVGIYAYGVVADSEELDLDVLPSIDGSHSLRLVDVSGVRVVVSSVSMAEFSETALKENLEKVHWLRQHVAAHERVQREVFRKAQILPLRFLTIFQNEESLIEMVGRRSREFGDLLTSLEDMVEMGVRVSIDRELVVASIRDKEQVAAEVAGGPAAQGKGSSYLLSRKVARDVKQAVDRAADRECSEIHREFSRMATTAVVLDEKDKGLSGRRDDSVLNAAYLIARSRIDNLATLVRERNEAYENRGFRIEATGPWPPYNFVNLEGTIE